MQILKGI